KLPHEGKLLSRDVLQLPRHDPEILGPALHPAGPRIGVPHGEPRVLERPRPLTPPAGGHPPDPRIPLHGLDDPPHRHHHPDEPAPDDRTPDPPRHDLGIDPEPQRHRTLVNPRPPTENEHVIGHGDIDLTVRHGVAHSAHEGTAHIAWSHPGETIRPLFETQRCA